MFCKGLILKFLMIFRIILESGRVMVRAGKNSKMIKIYLRLP